MKSISTEFTDIPNGRYKGTWSGRIVKTSLPDGTTREFYAKDGVKGFNVPCKVTATDGDMVVETLG